MHTTTGVRQERGPKHWRVFVWPTMPCTVSSSTQPLGWQSTCSWLRNSLSGAGQRGRHRRNSKLLLRNAPPATNTIARSVNSRHHHRAHHQAVPLRWNLLTTQKVACETLMVKRIYAKFVNYGALYGSVANVLAPSPNELEGIHVQMVNTKRTTLGTSTFAGRAVLRPISAGRLPFVKNVQRLSATMPYNNF